MRQIVNGQPENEPLLAAIDIIEGTIPLTVQNEVKRGWKANSEAKRSKFLKKPVVTMSAIVEFNGYMQAAIHDLERAEHVYEQNMIEAYYFQSLKESIREGRSLPPSKLDKHRIKALIFKCFPKFGNSFLSKNCFTISISILY